MNAQTQQLRITPDQGTALVIFETAVAQLALQAQILATFAPKLKDEAAVLRAAAEELAGKYAVIRAGWQRQVLVAQPEDLKALVTP